jgi:hypothetical protein
LGDGSKPTQTQKINCRLEFGLLAKTLNNASLPISKTKFAIDIQKTFKT